MQVLLDPNRYPFTPKWAAQIQFLFCPALWKKTALEEYGCVNKSFWSNSVKNVGNCKSQKNEIQELEQEIELLERKKTVLDKQEKTSIKFECFSIDKKASSESKKKQVCLKIAEACKGVNAEAAAALEKSCSDGGAGITTQGYPTQHPGPKGHPARSAYRRVQAGTAPFDTRLCAAAAARHSYSGCLSTKYLVGRCAS